MNQLIVSPVSLENSIGGIERYLDNLVRYCQTSGDNTFLLLPSSYKPSVEKIGNLSIYRKDFLKLDSKELFANQKIIHSETDSKAKDFYNFLLDFLTEKQIDIVNAQGFEFLYPKFNIALHMACFSKNIPAVLQVHTFPSKEIEKAMVFDMPWKKILAISKSVAGDLFIKGLDVEKIHTFYLGVDTKEFFPQKNPNWQKENINFPLDSKIILHASRITDGTKPILKEKGIITLLETFSKLSGNYDNYRLLIALGLPPADLKEEFYFSFEQLNNYIKLLSLEEKVILKPFKLEEMPFVYNSSDVFVLASENETLGQVFLEAMACGVPVIGTNVGGVPEIISDNESGFLVEPDDASTLSQKIVEIIENKDLRKSFIENGMKVIEENFTAERQFKLLFDYLKEIKES